MGLAHCETRKTVKTRNISEILLRFKEKASQTRERLLFCAFVACLRVLDLC